ncbi:TerC family protein [Dactylosporangium sp. NPDC050688]|uniref:TerC family protein n=1 Tax=Dactylosporangium sp. NPDC050688 TaxID=3157217 RepID=UPI0033FE731D
MLDVPIWLWATFGTAVVVMLAVDLFAHRKEHVIGFREAAKWSAVWVALSLAFAGLVWATLGAEAGVEFTTAWLLEKSLSVDNLFVFALIFGYFAVPKQYQHRALFYGVIGALIFRAIFIAAGVAIISKFTVVLFVFAAILLWSAYKLLKDDEEDYDPSTNIAVRLVRRIVPVQQEYAGAKFFVKQGVKWVATPMLVVVVAIEAADLVFAVDSVPAVLAVSDETFIVYSSNAFAILGLRALYFLLAGMLDKFRHLSKGLAIILAFIGVKLILQAAHKTISTAVPEIPSLVSLAVVVVVLAGSVVLSLRHPPAEPAELAESAEPLASSDAVKSPEGESVEEAVGRSSRHHG